MRIGVDASRAFLPEKTGTEEYSFQMLTHLLALPESRDHEWVLYLKPEDLVRAQHGLALVTGDHWRLRPIDMPRLWTQVGLAWVTWTDRLDILWVPAHTLPILRKPGLRTLVTIHGIEYEYLPAYENRLERWYLPLSTQYAMRSASHVIAVSEFTKRQLAERLGTDQKKVTVIHEGVALQRLKLAKRTVHAVMKKYAPGARPYMVFIGTVQPRKNLARLIAAYSDMATMGYDLLIIGKLGWDYADLRIDSHPHMKFLRYLSDVEKQVLLAHARGYVQPSITEGFGLPVLEAFAAGVPVASSTGGALSEVVGDAGVLFDPYNVADIQQAIKTVLTNDKVRDQLIKAGKLRLQQFTWQIAARRTYSILMKTYSHGRENG